MVAVDLYRITWVSLWFQSITLFLFTYVTEHMCFILYLPMFSVETPTGFNYSTHMYFVEYLLYQIRCGCIRKSAWLKNKLLFCRLVKKKKHLLRGIGYAISIHPRLVGLICKRDVHRRYSIVRIHKIRILRQKNYFEGLVVGQAYCKQYLYKYLNYFWFDGSHRRVQVFYFQYTRCVNKFGCVCIKCKIASILVVLKTCLLGKQ